MNLAGYYSESISNGEGYRAVIFMSGCPHNCTGCHNKEQQDKNYGEQFTEERQKEIIDEIVNNPIIQGITLSGGEPFTDYNCVGLAKIVAEILEKRPELDVWAYSGYKYEQIRKDFNKNQLLLLTDVLVDGKFVIGKFTPELKFKGSTNQRIIDVKKTLESETIVLWEETSVLKKFKL